MSSKANAGTMRRAGFTLIELLVVLGIIVLVASLLIAGLRRARESSQSVKCQNNLRQLMIAFRAFAHDHEDHLPGCFIDFGEADPSHRDWLFGVQNNLSTAPQGGTIWKYVNNYDTYLCPALEPYRGSYNAGVGFESNGRFDYAAFLIFHGANINTIPLQSRLCIGPGRFEPHGTPILCEEGANEINGADTEGGHSQGDPIAHNHPAVANLKTTPAAVNGVVMRPGGGHIACVDGSVEFVREPDSVNGANGKGALLWDAVAPSGQIVQLGADTAQNGSQFGGLWNGWRLR